MAGPHIVVVGGGFAGLWASAAAAAAARAAGTDGTTDITLVSPSPSLSIRPRLYEPDLAPTVVALAPILEPVGVRLRRAAATHLDLDGQAVRLDDGGAVPFDALVLAVGSHSPFPPVDGLAAHAHRIDVHHRAESFGVALAAVRTRKQRPRVTVVGGGLTGIELAAELASAGDLAVTLVDGGTVGEPFGEAAARRIRRALADLGVAVVDGDRAVAVDETAIALRSGLAIEHDVLVWCGGLRANTVPGLESLPRDELGRLAVDDRLRAGEAPLWVAGDAARVAVDGTHVAPMSCQFAIPTGRHAGFNAAASVLGLDPVPVAIDRYVTCIDLGNAGAVFTRGWDRELALEGEEGKRMKEFINRSAIYPPVDPAALLEEARPDVVAAWS